MHLRQEPSFYRVTRSGANDGINTATRAQRRRAGGELKIWRSALGPVNPFGNFAAFKYRDAVEAAA